VQGLLLDCRHLPDVEVRKVLAIDPCLSIGQHFVICIRMYFALWQNLTRVTFLFCGFSFLGD
jgi:hypothetical protein